MYPTTANWLNKVPEVTLSFWVIKILSTTVGETGADFLAVDVGLGAGITTLGMASLLATALFIQLRSHAYTPCTPVSVDQAFGQVLEDLLPLAEARQIDLGVEGDSGMQLALHELDLMTLVRNLVDNAICYTPAGGRIDLCAWRDAGGVTLQVRDTGPGIAPAEREGVFDPFYRTLGNTEAGTGLGLSIVRAIAQRNGLQVQLRDAQPAGAPGLWVQVRCTTDWPAG